MIVIYTQDKTYISENADKAKDILEMADVTCYFCDLQHNIRGP